MVAIMSALLVKPLRHLYRITKVYVALGLLGALLVIAWGVIQAHPQLAAFLNVTVAVIFLIIYLINKILVLRNRPPAIPDFILYTLLPNKISDLVIGDFHETYCSQVRLSLSHKGLSSRSIKLRADLWYWNQVFRSIGPLLRLRLTAERAAEDIAERIKQKLSLSRQYGNITTGNPFHDLWS